MDENKISENPFDPYNFSEIEKIQSDIEKDLNSHYEKIQNISPDLDSYIKPPPEELKDLNISSGTALTYNPGEFQVPGNVGDFYTETIKPPSGGRLLSRRAVAFLVILCTAGTAVLGTAMGFGIAAGQRHLSSQTADTEDFVSATLESTSYILGGDGTVPVTQGSLANVARIVDPAVVRISTVFRNQSPFPFFNTESNNVGGSGVIFAKDDENVFIVTNNHVVQGADDVFVYIADNDPVSAKLVGRNQNADLVVVSVSVEDVRKLGIGQISIAVFGDSDAMRVGDVVLAIGNAMGEGNTTTRGIISAAEKETAVRGRSLSVLQTDAAINIGGSGGPLVNTKGQVIGINIFTSSEHFAVEGMGFSIPSNIVKPVVETIMNQGPEPALGIYGKTLNDEEAAKRLVAPIGVLVSTVIAGTGADNAGIKPGDIITSFGGRAVFDIYQLQEEISKHEIGDTVEVSIIRISQERTQNAPNAPNIPGGHLVQQQLTLQVTINSNLNDNF